MARQRQLMKAITAGAAAAVLDGLLLNQVVGRLGLGDDVGRVLVGSAGQMLIRGNGGMKGLLKSALQAEVAIGAFNLGKGLAGGLGLGGSAGGAVGTL